MPLGHALPGRGCHVAGPKRTSRVLTSVLPRLLCLATLLQDCVHAGSLQLSKRLLFSHQMVCPTLICIHLSLYHTSLPAVLLDAASRMLYPPTAPPAVPRLPSPALHL